jgi:hypothetical protein
MRRQYSQELTIWQKKSRKGTGKIDLQAAVFKGSL